MSLNIFFNKFKEWVVVLLKQNKIGIKKRFFVNQIYQILIIIDNLRTNHSNLNIKNKRWKK